MNPDERYEEEEEWLRAQDAAWTWAGWGCVGFGVAVVTIFVLLVLAIVFNPMALK